MGEIEPQQQSEENRIYLTDDGLTSNYTKYTYHNTFDYFIKTTVKNKDLRALLDTKQSVIESKIIDHIRYLHEVRHLSYLSIQTHLSGILRFFAMNDYHLNIKKIRRFLPEDIVSELYTKDRPYSVKEIEQILLKCDVRSRAMVLIMSSTGMRIGGLRELRIGDIRKIDEFGLYLIWVYNRYRRDRYFTFCTPECAVAIDTYLDFRRRTGEELKDESPLIRERFSIENPFTTQAPKFVSTRTLSFIFEDLLKRSGINNQVKVADKNKRRAIMTSHGFRKFFINQSEKAGINYLSWKYLVGHKLKRTDASYIRMTEEDMLSEYVKAIDLLTISSESKLRRQMQNKENEVKFIHEEVSSLKRCVSHMISMMKQQGYDTQETENSFGEYTQEVTKRLDYNLT